MPIGERIKKIRNKRGMTQKELGVAAGFNIKNASVRIAQYELDIRTPKEKTLANIADALKVSPKTLENPDITIMIDTKFPVEGNKEYYAVGCWADFTENQCTVCDSIGFVELNNASPEGEGFVFGD